MICHQLLHGYEHGHQLLAGSTELTREEMDLVTRLSDLSGSMIPGEALEPYVSFYPLPSGSFFVVAKTWEDPGAPRAGCVLTHSLLMPIDAWAASRNLAGVSALHRRPDRTQLRSFTAPLTEVSGSGFDPIIDSNCDEFVAKFFGEGIRPLVWFGVRDAERYAWRIAQALWPALRVKFACCSFALQPRGLDERPFDLMFSPAAARSRFVEFNAANIVGATSEARSSPSSIEPWAREWREVVFAAADRPSPDILGLAAGLDGTPSAIRKVFLFVDLQGKGATAPLAAIGALDVLESLGCEEDQARELVTMLVGRAVESVRAAPLEWALEMLCLVGLRLDRLSELVISAGVHESLIHAVRECVAVDPTNAVLLAEGLSTRDPGRLPTTLVKGLAGAIAEHRTAETLQALARAHHVGRNLVDVSPSVTPQLLIAGRQLGVAFADVLTEWYQGARGAEARSTLRTLLGPLLCQKDESALLRELLKEVQRDEVALLCTQASRQIVDPDLGRLFCEYVGEASAPEVITASHGQRMEPSAALTFMVAGALPLDPSGLEDAYLWLGGENLVAAFVDRALHRAPPPWLLRACEGVQLWRYLLRGVDDSFACSVMSRLVATIDRSAIARTIENMQWLERAPSPVQYHAVRQMIVDHLTAEQGDLQVWVSAEWCARVITQDAPLLRNVIGDEIAGSSDSTRTWSAAWKTIEVVSSRVKPASGAVVEIIDLLLWRKPSPWPSQVTAIWCHVLANLTHDRMRYEVACTQAIRFSLDNTRLPLASVVAEAFYAVHEAALGTHSRPSWGFLGLKGWDKAGELRRRFVDAFYYSEWDPTCFVLAAREPWLLRKLCKRMMKQWRGMSYLERALAGLAPGPLARELSEILRHPEYREDWD